MHAEILGQVARISRGTQRQDTGYREAEIAYLKLVLVRLTRAKFAQLEDEAKARKLEPPILQALREAIKEIRPLSFGVLCVEKRLARAEQARPLLTL